MAAEKSGEGAGEAAGEGAEARPAGDAGQEAGAPGWLTVADRRRIEKVQTRREEIRKKLLQQWASE